jgi:hypothetical protein
MPKEYKIERIALIPNVLTDSIIQIWFRNSINEIEFGEDRMSLDEILEKYQIKIETIDVSDWSDLKGRKCHVDISWESKIENFNFIS